MCKKIAVLVSVALVVVLSGAVQAEMNYQAPQGTATIDGSMSAGEWDGAVEIDMSYPALLNPPLEGGSLIAAPTSATDLDVTWSMMWDSSNLYLAARVTDQDYVPVSDLAGNAHNGGDCMQLCFNPNADPAGVFADPGPSEAAIWDFVPDTTDNGADAFIHGGAGTGPVTALAIDGSFTGDGIFTPKGYIVEVALPWATVMAPVDTSYSPTAGDVHGIGFLAVDRDNDDSLSLILDFGSGANVIGTPSAWNKVTLVPEPATIALLGLGGLSLLRRRKHA